MHLGKPVRSQETRQLESVSLRSLCSRQRAVAGKYDQCVVSGLHESHLLDLRGLAGFVDHLRPSLEGSITPDCTSPCSCSIGVAVMLQLVAGLPFQFRSPTSSRLPELWCRDLPTRFIKHARETADDLSDQHSLQTA